MGGIQKGRGKIEIMILGKTVLAIVPARGGSKGIPRKNIKVIAGKPLIAWTIEEAKKSKYIDKLILSSEDEEIINVAKQWGCEVPFIRPLELAQDNTAGIEPVIHAIKAINAKYDYVCLLQPTSPLRKTEHIDGCIEKCILNNSDSCVSISEVKKHPYWMYVLNDTDIIKPFCKEEHAVLRQELPRLYVLNGAIYMAKADFITTNFGFIDDNTIGYYMDAISSIDIDEYLDFFIAECIIKGAIFNES